MMWFGQTGLNVNRFETSLSDSVNRAKEFNFYNYQIVFVYGNVISTESVS